MSDWEVKSVEPVLDATKGADGGWSVLDVSPTNKRKANVKAMGLPSIFEDDAMKRLDADVAPDTAPKWDIPGDMGRAGGANIDAMGNALSALNPFKDRSAILAKDKQYSDKYGPFAGPLVANFNDFIDTGKAAATIPLSALGTLMSPLTGTAHALGGSALSYLPGMNKQKGDEAVDQMMMMLAPGRGRAAVAAAPRPGDPLMAKFQEARQAGYSISPDGTGQSGSANVLAGIGGKTKTQQLASVKNQEVTTKLAKEALGLPESAVLDETTFDKVRADAGQSYQALKDTTKVVTKGTIKTDATYHKALDALDAADEEVMKSFPNTKRSTEVADVQNELRVDEFTPEAAVEKIKQLRYNATRNLKAGYQSPALEDLGLAQRKAANALEDMMDRHLKTVADDATLTSERADPNALKARDVTPASVQKIKDLEAEGRTELHPGMVTVLDDVAKEAAGASLKDVSDDRFVKGLINRLDKFKGNSAIDGITNRLKTLDLADPQKRLDGLRTIDFDPNLSGTNKTVKMKATSIPVITVREGAAERVIDGAKRVALAKERSETVPTISISEGRYDILKDAGFTDMEIAYGALDSAGYTTAAGELAKQFPKADIASVGPSLSKEFSKFAQVDKDALTNAVTNYRNARVTIAKAHTIEDATDAAGNVDARKIAKAGGKVPLTGPLKTIATAAETFPKSFQKPATFGGNEKLSVLDWAAMIGSGMGALGSGQPLVAAGALLPLGRIGARSLALSNSLQNRLAGLNAPSNIGRNFLRGLPPSAAAGAQIQGPQQGGVP